METLQVLRSLISSARSSNSSESRFCYGSAVDDIYLPLANLGVPLHISTPISQSKAQELFEQGQLLNGRVKQGVMSIPKESVKTSNAWKAAMLSLASKQLEHLHIFSLPIRIELHELLIIGKGTTYRQMTYPYSQGFASMLIQIPMREKCSCVVNVSRDTQDNRYEFSEDSDAVYYAVTSLSGCIISAQTNQNRFGVFMSYLISADYKNQGPIPSLLEDSPMYYNAQNRSWRLARAEHIWKAMFEKYHESEDVGTLTENPPQMLAVRLKDLSNISFSSLHQEDVDFVKALGSSGMFEFRLAKISDALEFHEYDSEELWNELNKIERQGVALEKKYWTIDNGTCERNVGLKIQHAQCLDAPKSNFDWITQWQSRAVLLLWPRFRAEHVKCQICDSIVLQALDTDHLSKGLLRAVTYGARNWESSWKVVTPTYLFQKVVKGNDSIAICYLFDALSRYVSSSSWPAQKFLEDSQFWEAAWTSLINFDWSAVRNSVIEFIEIVFRHNLHNAVNGISMLEHALAPKVEKLSVEEILVEIFRHVSLDMERANSTIYSRGYLTSLKSTVRIWFTYPSFNAKREEVVRLFDGMGSHAQNIIFTTLLNLEHSSIKKDLGILARIRLKGNKCDDRELMNCSLHLVRLFGYSESRQDIFDMIARVRLVSLNCFITLAHVLYCEKRLRKEAIDLVNCILERIMVAGRGTRDTIVKIMPFLVIENAQILTDETKILHLVGRLPSGGLCNIIVASIKLYNGRSSTNTTYLRIIKALVTFYVRDGLPAWEFLRPVWIALLGHQLAVECVEIIVNTAIESKDLTIISALLGYEVLYEGPLARHLNVNYEIRELVGSSPTHLLAKKGQELLLAALAKVNAIPFTVDRQEMTAKMSQYSCVHKFLLSNKKRYHNENFEGRVGGARWIHDTLSKLEERDIIIKVEWKGQGKATELRITKQLSKIQRKLKEVYEKYLQELERILSTPARFVAFSDEVKNADPDIPHPHRLCRYHAGPGMKLKHCSNCVCYLCGNVDKECTAWEMHCLIDERDSMWIEVKDALGIYHFTRSKRQPNAK